MKSWHIWEVVSHCGLLRCLPGCPCGCCSDGTIEGGGGAMSSSMSFVRNIGLKQEGVNCLWNIFANIEGRLKYNEESIN